MSVTILIRGGTAAEWAAADPVLHAREMGLETDTQKFKFGDGVTAWSGLPYAGSTGSGTVTDVTATAPLASSGGATPDISITLPADASKYLDGTGAFTTPAGGGTVTDVTASAPLASSGGTTPDISASDFDGTNSGLVPAGPADATKYLDGSGNFTVPAGSGGTVTDVTATAPVTSSGGATPDIAVPVFVASGASHAAGLVPDPGASGGTTKFLREDATFAVPAGGSGNSTSTGAAGSEPGSPNAGDLYFPNNGFVVNRYASVWANNWGPVFPLTFPPPIVSTITTTQGSNGGSITNVATSVVVSSSSGFPAAPFLVSIGTEDIKVTVVAGTTWTIVRGYNGTTNASHTDGATITLINWEWVNQGTATVAQTPNNGIFMSAPPSTINARVYKRLIGSNTSLRAAFMPNMFNSGAGVSWAGIVLRESSTGRLETMAWVPTTTIAYRLVCEYDSSPTSQTFDDLISTTFVQPGPSFFRIDPTGTNMLFYVSTDGQNWIQVLSLAKTAHFSSGPDEWGILVGEYSNVSTRPPAALTLISWLEQ